MNTPELAQNRTNVRFSDGLVEAMAVALFKTPRRGRLVELDGARNDLLAAGHRLATWAWGAGPTVLLVHGWNGHAAQLRGFVDPLVSEGYRVVALDLPAHGHSTGERAHVLDFAEAVRAIATREAAVSIVAHSLGATASALAVARGLPVRRLALLAPPAEVPYFARGAASLLGLTPEQTEGMLDGIRRELGGDLDALDLRRLASTLGTKLLVMHDPEDREVPFEHGRSIAENARDVRFAAPIGAGHRGMLRDPQLIEHVVNFIAGEV